MTHVATTMCASSDFYPSDCVYLTYVHTVRHIKNTNINILQNISSQYPFIFSTLSPMVFLLFFLSFAYVYSIIFFLSFSYVYSIIFFLSFAKVSKMPRHTKDIQKNKTYRALLYKMYRVIATQKFLKYIRDFRPLCQGSLKNFCQYFRFQVLYVVI